MLVSTSLKLIFGLLGLLIVVRLIGKKSLSNITPFDLVYTLVLGGILEESIYDDKVNIGHLLFALTLWAVMIYFIERVVQKKERINHLLKGEPSILIKNGALNLKELSRNHIEMEQLRTMLRQQQCFSVENARHVVLENAGQISLVKESDEDKVMSIMVIDEGKIQNRVLQTHDLERAWLMEQLEREGYHSLEDILYAEWSEEKGFYVVTNDDVLNKAYRIDG